MSLVGRPLRPLFLEGANHGGPRKHLVKPEPLIDERETSAVAEKPAHENVLFAERCELRPVANDRCIEVECTRVGKVQSANREDTLGAREHQRERVLLPSTPTLPVGGSAPKVDDLAPLDVRGRRCSELAVVLVVPTEAVVHRAEADIDLAVNRAFHHG